MKRALHVMLIILLSRPALATWSVIAVDPDTGRVGIASATCVAQYRLAGIGARDLMDIQAVVAPGRGVAACQAGVDRTRQNQALILRELRKGTSPQEILQMLEDDPDIDRRQFGIADIEGRSAQFSGRANIPVSAAIQGKVPGKGIVFSVQGNILAGEGVVEDAAHAFLHTTGSLADRLMAALEAGDRAGGDRRCTCETEPRPPAPCARKTAHVAYILVADSNGPSGGTGPGYGLYISVTDEDIRPEEDANPVTTLRMRYESWKRTAARP